MPEVGTAGKVRQGKLNWKPCQSGEEEEEEGAERKGKEGKEKREVAATNKRRESGKNSQQ